MDNKFIKDSSFFFITSIVTGSLGFITLPIYTRHLSPSDFGILALFFLFGAVVVSLVSVGLVSSSYRYYFEYKNDPKSFQLFNTTNVVFNVITFLFSGLFIYYSASWISNHIFDNKISPQLLQLSYLSGCLNYFIKESQAFFMVTKIKLLIHIIQKIYI